MSQREISLAQVMATRASGAVVLIFLLIVGAGGYSLDGRMKRVGASARVSGAAV